MNPAITVDQGGQAKVVALLAEVYHKHYCAADAIPQHMKHRVQPEHFASWAKKHMTLFDRSTFECKDEDTWDTATRVVFGTGQTLRAIWYAIALADREVPVVELESVGMAILLRYTDGCVSPVMIDMPIVGGKAEPTDGEVASILTAGFEIIVRAFVEDGLTVLHHKGTNLNSDTEESTAETFVRIMREGLVALPEVQQRAVAFFAEVARRLAYPKTPETHPQG